MSKAPQTARKPSRFALQMRTRLVMILATGVLAYVNVRVRKGGLETVPLVQPEPGMVVHLWEPPMLRGWPVDFYKAFKSGFAAWSAEGIAIDVVAALMIVGVAIVTCEWMLRKKTQ